MMYTIKEMFVTLQGEGLNAGRKALFVRFAGCNLWSGREQDRNKGQGACSRWCDTDFFKGEKFNTAEEVVIAMNHLWPESRRLCVLTGGEPAMQIDEPLMKALMAEKWECAVETNGTVENSILIGYSDHICLSPKVGTVVLLDYIRHASEIKVVLPGAVPAEDGWDASTLRYFVENCRDAVLYVQPQDPLVTPAIEDTALHLIRERRHGMVDEVEMTWVHEYEDNVKRCVDWVLSYPEWRLTLQTHKMIGLR